MLHLIIPTRNEAPYIADTIRRLSKSLSDLTIPWQITIADNGSTDQTQQTIEELMRTSSYVDSPGADRSQDHVPRTMDQVEYLECPVVGKGAAIRHAAKVTTWDVGRRTSDDRLVFGFIDADLSADPDAIPGMINRILEDKADIVIASRLLITKTTNRSWLRTISSQAFNFFADLILKLDVEDAQCGLKIMNQKGLEILKTCKEEGWFLDIEFLTRARQDKLRITEIPVPWLEFRYPHRKSHIKHMRDGLEAIRAIYRIKYHTN